MIVVAYISVVMVSGGTVVVKAGVSVVLGGTVVVAAREILSVVYKRTVVTFSETLVLGRFI